MHLLVIRSYELNVVCVITKNVFWTLCFTYLPKCVVKVLRATAMVVNMCI